MGTPITSTRDMRQVAGHLLYAGYEYDDDLILDLYGSVDEDGYHVESVAIAGSTVEIAQLFHGRQMEHMGLWLALKDGNPTQREWADRHKHHAAAYTN